MNIRVNIAAIFLVFVQVICVQLVSAEQSSNSTALTAAIQQDAIQQFVQGDFAQRRALLKQWPGSIEQLDQLAEYVENEQLYSGANGQTYILESDEKLLSYPSLGIVADWPSDLSQVTLVNTLRKALNFGLAQRKLKSEDASERLEAIDIYESNLAELNVAHINALYLNEQNNKVKARLAQLKARLDYQDADVLVKIQAAKALQDSNRPDVLAMIDNELTQPNIHSELKAALLEAKSSIKTRIQASEWTGHLFSGLSTASILLLAALGLAITYGLLGVINMAHGELIMIGAYTTYVVQSLFKSYLGSYVEWYLIAAIPAAFLVSGLIGMLIERTVIRPLYGRQLETLLATFGVSLILMQLVRMTFGAQNVEVSNISWLSGGISITPSLMLPYNRIAIIVFTIAVLLLLVYLLNKTRFGLFVRAVTQNRQMARAVGIRSSRIDMMAFGLGSGLAGLAGCALAQVGNVGPDLGQNYIIDAFLVVVVGGVGQVWGAVLAALGLGISGTALEIGIGAVLAKIVLLVLVILFIQKRPQGLFAIKGRFVE
ncbi:urea ABC transporter permease subunit UrtB [Acinetobacter lwoffii]|jgi:urea transport system permease protein|uniref:Urea ABC transporter permease subunit UrtB n=1 Tax=Acinetobacter lwoffii TaxID=28090 RepID=A0A646MQU1_ACILW|nr:MULTISPECIES: urea ABC transporter permease subunit UrtB [Acinetobacter]ECF7044620.1 urea ABC transporter permease subunit UrtB [Salmonella enterica subsp. enterica]ODN53169.1 urea ABC transporter permease subunit UrtB [Acinetobacter sp. 51m]ECF7063824.1 urea ABC transporter permease subunit UrtB [Salmonella enterica subsp. enterica]ENX24181.1 urea ABC transporter, permease UrtB [Acinetobacter sp. CIP 102136]MDP1318268.1 urea ABC transporter permease subunit UrtB [Acinetobacter lwoffii]